MPDNIDDSIWGKNSRLTVVGDDRKLVLRAARLPDPKDIPPRPWLYGTQLLRGYVSKLVGLRGVGTIDFAMGVGLALTSGRSIFGEQIFQRCRVAILNLQYSLDELERRLAALVIHHRIDHNLVEGRFLLTSSRDGRMATTSQTSLGCTVVHPHEGPIIRGIQKHNIDVLVVDPFAEMHVLKEEPNPQMVKATVAWRQVARTTGCAILLVQDVSTPSPQMSPLRIVFERPPAGILHAHFDLP